MTWMYHLSNVPFGGSLLYLSSIVALHNIVRSPVHIPQAVLFFYNVLQVVLNAYVAYKIASPLEGRVWGIGQPDSPTIRYAVFLHYICKYVDFLDTVIIVLRKKTDQLSFLHLYHHATVGLVWGWVINTWPTAEEGGSAAYVYGAWINSCIHVIMYAYYGLSALRITIPKPVKKAVTTCQLIQFASCIVHAVAALLIDETPYFYNAVQVAYHITMLKLFLPLLKKTASISFEKDRKKL